MSASPATGGANASQDSPSEQLPPPLFYERPLPISSQYHATFKTRPELDFSFAAETNAVPITLPEFVLAARSYPIIFIGEELVPSVAVGLRPSDNLFVDVKGAWDMSHYIPAYVRRYPFILMNAEGENQLQLGIDDDSRSSKQGAQALFADGKETETITQAIGLCEHFHGAFQFTRDFTEALKKIDITESRSLEVELPNKEKFSVGTFVAVNEEKFRAIPDATIIEWHRKGWLHAIYFHLQSLNNWEALMGRMSARMNAAAGIA